MIGDHEIGPGASDSGEDLERRLALVEPALLRRGFRPAVLTAHVVGREWNVGEPLPRGAQAVEVGEGRLHQQQVRPFGDVEGALAYRFAYVGGVHLVALAGSGLRRAPGGPTKRPIKPRCELRRIGHDWDM